jgi:hypothetical protein
MLHAPAIATARIEQRWCAILLRGRRRTMQEQGLCRTAGLMALAAWMGSVAAAAPQAQGPAQGPGTTASPQVSASAPAGTAAAPTSSAPGKHKGGKEAYTGPTQVVVLPPAPSLDEEGHQRLDPDGKPMFNPPVMQQRDKHGHPLFDEHGNPVFQTAGDLGYDEHGHKIKVKREKPPKMTPVSISRGTFTVDGVIGKAALNYDIADLKYIYLYVPGEGVAVVSNQPFAGASEQKDAFVETSLKVSVDGHALELASDKRLLGKKPASAYVLVDREFKLPSRFPVVGYGTLRKAPYAWPGAKQGVAFAGPIQPPPVPEALRPVLAKAGCPAGQVGNPAAGKQGAPGCVAAKGAAAAVPPVR